MRAKEFSSAGESKQRFVEMFQKFLPLCMEILKLDSLPKMVFEPSIGDTDQPTFGKYDNETETLHVALANRHPNDILRTIAHELTHYKQGKEHMLGPDSGKTGSPIENQANAMAGIVMRNFNKQYPEYLRVRPIIAENFTNDKVKGTELKNSIPTGLYFDIDDVSINQSYRGSGIGALLYKLVITCIDRLNPKVKGLLSPRKNRLSTAANVSKIYSQLGGKVGINGAKDTYDLLPIKNYIKLEVEPQPGAQIAAISEKNISFLVDEAGPYRVVLTVFDHNIMKPIGFISATASFWDSETETLDNENISENFADGKNPQDKGDSKRHGVPTKASVSTLRKVAKQGGRKGQLAHWMANMKAGKAKKK